MSDFVGRAAELSRLRTELELVKAGTPRTVLVKGPPGIGKSALVGRLVEQAAVGSVLRPSGDEAEACLSCGLVTQLGKSKSVRIMNIKKRRLAVECRAGLGTLGGVATPGVEWRRGRSCRRSHARPANRKAPPRLMS